MKPMRMMRMIRVPGYIVLKEELKMDPKKAQERLNELRNRRRKDYWMPSPGKNYVRFLPNWNLEPDGDFYRETGYHRKLGHSRDKSAVCLIKEGFEKCPVCEMTRELYRSKEAENVELAKAIRRQDRVFYNIIDLNNKDKGVQVYVSGTDVLEQLLGFCANPKYGDCSDAANGRNVELVLTEGKNTKSGYNSYDIQPDPDRTQIEKVEWLESLVDLDAMIKPMPYEKVEALLLGNEAAESGEESQEESKPEAKSEKAEEHKAETPAPKAKPPCFSKFSSDDAECMACLVKVDCEETKKQKRMVKEEKPAEQPKAEAPHDRKAENMQAMIDKIKRERAEKK